MLEFSSKHQAGSRGFKAGQRGEIPLKELLMKNCREKEVIPLMGCDRLDDKLFSKLFCIILMFVRVQFKYETGVNISGAERIAGRIRS